jgi:ferredoxin
MDDPTGISKVVVDKDKCIGSANCVAIYPDLFDLDEDGKAYVKDGVDLADVQRILEAAQSCPVDAILVYDQNGKQIHP